MRFKILFLVMPLLVSVGCASLKLSPADFSWPVENALKVDDKGFISEDRYTFSIKVKNLFFAEFNDSTNFAGKELRIIRDVAGFYFITGKDFKNVYIFVSDIGGMKLENKIEILKESGFSSPAFNQKAPNIELLDGTNKYLLNNKGIVR